MKAIKWGSLFAYLGVGGFSILLALFVVSQFVPASFSQNSGPSSEVGVPATSAQISPPPGANVGSIDPQLNAGGNGSGPESSQLENTVRSFLEAFNYDAEGRRDPFKSYRSFVSGGVAGPILPMQRFDLQDIRLIGIIWDVSNPKAMFLDPDNQIHVLGKDHRIGRNNGYIAVIREGEVVIVEPVKIKGELSYTTQVLKITQ